MRSLTKQPVFWAACVAVAFVLIVVLANLGGGGGSSSGTEHTIDYSVTGTVDGPTIYYYDEQQNAQHVDHARLPWTKTFTVHGNNAGFRVGAVLKGNSGHGRLTCIMRVDGEIKATHTTTSTDPQVRCAPPS